MAKSSSEYTSVIGRIPILDLFPQQPDNLWPSKAFAGEVVPFRATAFREGHDLIGTTLLLTDPSGVTSRHAMRLIEPGLDRWEVLVRLDRVGLWTYRVRAYSDDFATWVHDAGIKVPAGVDVDLMFQIGSRMLERAAAQRTRPAAERQALQEAATLLTSKSALPAKLAVLSDERLRRIALHDPISSLQSRSPSRSIRVERTRAGVGSWYEFFPRSVGASQDADGTWTSGTFRTAAGRLPEVAAMGFDVVYLPPIHPIGNSFRKGPNNTLDAGPGDPGSPWAIGAEDGGHDAIHPDLGDEEDFAYFVTEAQDHGLEVAIDLALQASPDHPWVREHPEWFTTLPDGTIAYAENPPKKYQDIYPVNFDNDPEGIRAEVLRILKRWISAGVRIFRVDNPHTKPLAFWEWLLHTVNEEHPDVVFLAEAFTRPPMLQALAKVGFQQSYTYFTWRNTKAELEEFLTSISAETAAFLRPNLFVNTPDILTDYLQFGGPAAFKVRAAIAATASPSWGVYSGYELYESVARPGAEEYIDNEKYEYRPRDYAAAQAQGESLAAYLTMLNRARRDHPALRQLRNLQLHHSDDDAILVFSKRLDKKFAPGGDTVIVVANVDPHSSRETMVHLDLAALGLAPGTRLSVTDLVTGASWEWGADNYVRLDPYQEPVHILTVHHTGHHTDHHTDHHTEEAR